MSRKSVPGSAYPADWSEIAKRVKDASAWKCIRCGVAHDPPLHVLTVHHMDMSPDHSGPEWWFNLASLCARCHLSVQGRVNLDRPWVMAEHSEWAKPLMAGHYARKYRGLFLTRPEVMARMDELLGLEIQAVSA